MENVTKKKKKQEKYKKKRFLGSVIKIRKLSHTTSKNTQETIILQIRTKSKQKLYLIRKIITRVQPWFTTKRYVCMGQVILRKKLRMSSYCFNKQKRRKHKTMVYLSSILSKQKKTMADFISKVPVITTKAAFRETLFLLDPIGAITHLRESHFISFKCHQRW